MWQSQVGIPQAGCRARFAAAAAGPLLAWLPEAALGISAVDPKVSPAARQPGAELALLPALTAELVAG